MILNNMIHIIDNWSKSILHPTLQQNANSVVDLPDKDECDKGLCLSHIVFLLAQFSLYVHKGGLKPDSFHFPHRFTLHTTPLCSIISSYADIKHLLCTDDTAVYISLLPVDTRKLLKQLKKIHLNLCFIKIISSVSRQNMFHHCRMSCSIIVVTYGIFIKIILGKKGISCTMSRNTCISKRVIFQNTWIKVVITAEQFNHSVRILKLCICGSEIQLQVGEKVNYLIWRLRR